MPRGDFFRVLDSIARATDPHRVFVTITGGEPLLRDDLELCGQGIFERGFPWGIVTNGLALSPARLESLRKAGMHSITISLDGLEESHNWMRRHPQSFQRVDEALQLLPQYPRIASDVVTCVNQRNYDELPSIRDYLIGKGITHWRIYSIFPVGRAANDPQMQITSRQFRGMLDAGGAVGRKLDFLVQEMNREANTTGSKCTDLEITRIVVDMKAEIEKIREQIQNIE